MVEVVVAKQDFVQINIKKMKKTKTKTDLKKEREKLISLRQDNLNKINAELSNPSGMSHGEMKKLLQGVRVFKAKIKELDKKIGDEKA